MPNSLRVLLSAGFRNMPSYNVYSCTNFRGHYPVGAAAVIVAQHPVQARSRLYNALVKAGLAPTHAEAADWIFKLIDIKVPEAFILNDGNY